MINFSDSKRICLSALFLLTGILLFSQTGVTVVRGKVLDGASGEPLSEVSVRFDDTSIGTRTGKDGSFFLKAKDKGSRIVIVSLGYDPLTVVIKPGETNDLQLRLQESQTDLKEVEIVANPRKYRNKNNPAVDIMRLAIDHKRQNRKENLGFYNFERYDKVGFAINNITDKFRNYFLFKKVRFIFENVDTSAATGKVNLPFFLRETLADIYYRKSPKEEKTYLRAERSTRLPGYLDDEGISNQIETLYQEIDFYKDAVNIVTVDFISPLADIAPNIYRFYIEDTSLIGDTRCVHLFFAPRQKTDLAFIGDLWIALDSSYALRKIHVKIPPQINLNWVNGLEIEQTYDWVSTPPGRGLMLSQDKIVMEFAMVKDKESKSILAHKVSSYAKYQLEQPLSDSLFQPIGKTIRDLRATEMGEPFWAISRHDTLNKREAGVYQMIDSLNHHRPFRRFMNTVKLFADGYWPVAGVDIGPLNSFMNQNPIEGFRLRVGGRTNLKFNNRLLLEGYAAYGTNDHRMKGFGGFRYSFSKEGPVMKYPLNQLRVWYQNDLQIPGAAGLQNGLFQSFNRGVNNRMLYTQIAGAEYLLEKKNGFSWAVSFRKVSMLPAGALTFQYLTMDGVANRPSIQTAEAGLMLRYAPNEKFYQSPDYRSQIFNKYPILSIWYTVGLRGVLDGQYNYQTVQFNLGKGIFLSPFGWSETHVEGGRTFGQLPYPLLTAHRANQTYFIFTESYNLMNFLEFVSDKYISFNITHNFGGFFFNRIPLIRRFNFREIITFKALWGGLDERNRPGPDRDLLLFPVNDAGETLTYFLGKQPYVEAGIGVSNIFKFLRLDLIRRFSYLDHPGISPLAIRAKFQMEF